MRVKKEDQTPRNPFWSTSFCLLDCTRLFAPDQKSNKKFVTLCERSCASWEASAAGFWIAQVKNKNRAIRTCPSPTFPGLRSPRMCRFRYHFCDLLAIPPSTIYVNFWQLFGGICVKECTPRCSYQVRKMVAGPRAHPTASHRQTPGRQEISQNGKVLARSLACRFLAEFRD